MRLHQMVQNSEIDTIVAEATPSGFGGIGIVRVSGPLVVNIAQNILKKIPTQNRAEVLPFLNKDGETIDEGIALYFKAPHSFTGEDVIEFQGHGGPVVIQMIIREIITLGARLARAGEFSERAFLNNKIDLLQAEAIASLIHSSSEQAAKSALRSLNGQFSTAIQNLLEDLILLRMHVESQIDFPEEEIEQLGLKKLEKMLEGLLERVEQVFKEAKMGALLSEGAKVVIMGPPNAGKSSLLNALSGVDVAIVTEIPGTTRDLLKERINLDGLLLEFVDTAGLRESFDVVEQEGIRRALDEIKKADHILFMLDATQNQDPAKFSSMFPKWLEKIPESIPMTILINKIDLLNISAKVEKLERYNFCYVSAKTGQGLDLFREYIKESFSFKVEGENSLGARVRHVETLKSCKQALLRGQTLLKELKALELMAEELKEAQKHLDEITGKFTSDDLLGKIFSEFCIGK